MGDRCQFLHPRKKATPAASTPKAKAKAAGKAKGKAKPKPKSKQAAQDAIRRANANITWASQYLNENEQTFADEYGEADFGAEFEADEIFEGDEQGQDW